MPRFSVIIPVYNGENYLNECIDSIVNQTYDDFEIILVNDGSQDSSPQICDEYAGADHRVKVIHKENGGVTAARKDAALVASGEYIVCVDADDWIDETSFAQISQVIDKNPVDIICHGLYVDDGSTLKKCPLKERFGLYTKEDIKKEIFPHLIQDERASYFAPALCGKAIRRELLLDNLITDSKVRIGEDGACVVPCVFHAESMYIMEQCLYYYRYNTASATKSKKVFNWDGPQLIAEHICTKMDCAAAGLQEQLDRKIVHEVFSVVLTQFYRKETYREIVADIEKELHRDIYYRAIQNCRFRGSLKAKLMEYSLRYQIYPLIWLYAKLR